MSKYSIKKVYLIYTLRGRVRVKIWYFFNYFHNLHPEVRRQSLRFSPYAQPLQQEQENYQRYILNENLS